MIKTDKARQWILDQLDIINMSKANGVDCSANEYILRGGCLMLDQLGFDVVVVSENDISIIAR